MSSIAIAVLVFGCTFLGACIGILFRGVLHDSHFSDDSRDVIKLVMGLIATVAALVLSLLISSAHRSHDAQEAEVQQLGVHLFQLDKTLERFGPDAEGSRRLLRRIVSAEVEYASTAGQGFATDKPLHAQKDAADLFDSVANLAPKAEGQKFMQAQALHLLAGLGDTRLLLNEQARATISWPFLIVLVFWLTVLFVGFGLLAPRNPIVLAAMFFGAMSVAGAVFLILELSRPYGGVMQISLTPIHNALTPMTP